MTSVTDTTTKIKKKIYNSVSADVGQSKAQGPQTQAFAIILFTSKQPELVQSPPRAGELTNAQEGLLDSLLPSGDYV